MLYLDPHEEEEYFPNYHIFQMIPLEQHQIRLYFRPGVKRRTHFDLLYSNSMCRQSSIPTSILILLFVSGGIRKEWTHISRSFTTSPILLVTVILTKYLQNQNQRVSHAISNTNGVERIRQSIPEFDVDSTVTFVLFLNILEVEIEGLSTSHFSWCDQFLNLG